MKKLISLILVLVLAFSLLTACGNSTNTQASEENQTNTKTNEGSHTEFKFRAQTGGTITGTAYLFMQAFADKLAEVSDGNLTCDVQAENSFDENQALDELLNDNIDFVYLASGSASGTVKDVCYLGVPGTYKYADTDDVTTFADFEAEMHDTMVSIYENYNAHYLTMRAPSMMVIESVDAPIHSVDDMKGLIIRVSGSWMGKMFAAMGISTSTIQKGEVATALQRKTIDGAVTGLEQAWNSMQYEVCSNMAIMTETDGVGSLVICASSWDKLDDTQKAWVQEAADYYLQKSIQDTHDRTTMQIADFEAAGLELYYFTDEECVDFVQAVPTIYEEMDGSSTELGKALRDKIVAWREANIG